MSASQGHGSHSASSHRVSGLMLGALGATAFSGKAIIVKLAYRYGADAVTLIMLRMLFALPFFVALAWWASRPREGGPAVVPLTRRDWIGVVGLGVSGYYLSSYLDFMGLAYISAALERLILYLNPTLVLILGVLVYRRHVSHHQMTGMAISYAGILLVFGHELSFAGSNVPLGAALVLASAVSYAIYLTYSGELVARLGSLRLVGLATSVACLLCIGQFALTRPLSIIPAIATEVIWLSVLNATVCTVVPVLLVMMSIERIGAGLTAQAGMVGPVSTIAMGVLILGEPFNTWVLAGTVLVLAGIWVCSGARPLWQR